MGIVKEAVGAVAEGYIKTLATAADVAVKSYFGDHVQGEAPVITHINERKEKLAGLTMANEAKEFEGLKTEQSPIMERAANDSPKMSKQDFIDALKRIRSETSITSESDQQSQIKSGDFER
jgi:hypothetical protein